jgi:hypothetical protein
VPHARLLKLGRVATQQQNQVSTGNHGLSLTFSARPPQLQRVSRA